MPSGVDSCRTANILSENESQKRWDTMSSRERNKDDKPFREQNH
jgi:hypothetical protein